MTLADYEFYQEEYKGTLITQELFEKFANMADSTLKYLSFNRDFSSFENQYNLAICELADYFFRQSTSDNKTITSESVGNYRVDYDTTKDQTTYDLAFKYLGFTGLLSAAVCS